MVIFAVTGDKRAFAGRKGFRIAWRWGKFSSIECWQEKKPFGMLKAPADDVRWVSIPCQNVAGIQPIRSQTHGIGNELADSQPHARDGNDTGNYRGKYETWRSSLLPLLLTLTLLLWQRHSRQIDLTDSPVPRFRLEARLVTSLSIIACPALTVMSPASNMNS